MPEKCDRCGEPVTLAQQVTVYGGTVVLLCRPCANEWDDTFCASALWHRVLCADARQNYYQSLARGGSPTVSEDRWIALRLDQEANEAAARAFAREWLSSSALDPTPDH